MQRSNREASEGKHGRATSEQAGFTMVEVLAVVAILAMLMAITLYGANKYRQRAYVEGTRGLLDKVRAALEEYRSTYSAYPPDGYDSPVNRPRGGGQIRGSQVLIHLLGTPTIKIAEYGDELVRQELEPFLELTLDMLSGAGDLEQRLADPNVELLDPYGNPIFYDNVERVEGGAPRFTAMGRGESPDPRMRLGGRARNPGSYDLWSSGPELTDPEDDIANWQSD